MSTGLLWLIPAPPLAGFALLAFLGARLTRRATAAIGVGGIGLAALATFIAAGKLLSLPETERVLSQPLWTWLSVSGLSAQIALRLDALSLVMALVVTVIGFFIHLYSAEYMAEDERPDRGYARFFAYMNLFVAMMLTLVLADNLLLLYVGWEGVGLCSYLLIGFWYQDPANGAAARKAFIVTRIGDTALTISLFLLVAQFRTLDIAAISNAAQTAWTPDGALAVAVALLLLGGAVGKSAQLPLQT